MRTALKDRAPAMWVRRRASSVDLQVLRALNRSRRRPQARWDDLSLLCVYRSRNAAHVARWVTAVEELGGRAYLWALDDVVPSLRERTVGAGAGSRSRLLSGLAEASAAAGRRRVVVADDDVDLVAGDVDLLLRCARDGGFALAQPAHSLDSLVSYGFTVGRVGLVARATRFVEIGPVIVVDPAFFDRVFPIPERYEMGWGLDVEWHQRRGPGERFGIVDATRIRHLGAVGQAYTDAAAEDDSLAEALRAAGLDDIRALCVTDERWAAWQADPSWVPAPRRASPLGARSGAR